MSQEEVNAYKLQYKQIILKLKKEIEKWDSDYSELFAEKKENEEKLKQ